MTSRASSPAIRWRVQWGEGGRDGTDLQGDRAGGHVGAGREGGDRLGDRAGGGVAEGPGLVRGAAGAGPHRGGPRRLVPGRHEDRLPRDDGRGAGGAVAPASRKDQACRFSSLAPSALTRSARRSARRRGSSGAPGPPFWLPEGRV